MRTDRHDEANSSVFAMLRKRLTTLSYGVYNSTRTSKGQASFAISIYLPLYAFVHS
jgi:hypothetical protein